MKRVIILVLAVMLAFSACAESEDTMYLVNTGDIKVYFTGEYMDDSTWGTELKQLQLETIVENRSSKAIKILAEDVSINNWDVFGQWQYSAFQEIQAGHNAKLYLYCNLDAANLSVFADVNELKLKVQVCDADSFKTILTTDELTFIFNEE